MSYSMMDPNMGFSISPDFAGGGSSAASSVGGLAGMGIGTLLGGPVGGALVSGLGSLVGGLFGNKSSAKEANAARMFQLYMSNTAHQREVADLRAAGLNPILSVNHTGASSPGSAPAQQSDPITPAINSAMSFMRMMAETNRLDAEARRDQAQAALDEKRFKEDIPAYEASNLDLQRQLNQARTNLIDAEIKAGIPASSAALNRAKVQEAQAYVDLMNAQRLTEGEKKRLFSADADNQAEILKTLKTEGKVSESDAGLALAYLKRVGGALGSFLDLIPQTRTIRQIGGNVRTITSGHGGP